MRCNTSDPAVHAFWYHSLRPRVKHRDVPFQSSRQSPSRPAAYPHVLSPPPAWYRSAADTPTHIFTMGVQFINLNQYTATYPRDGVPASLRALPQIFFPSRISQQTCCEATEPSQLFKHSFRSRCTAAPAHAVIPVLFVR